MIDKLLYANDIIHRNVDHTFTETVINSEIKVELKDSGSVLIRSAQKIMVVDAYSTIRRDLLNGENPAFLSTTTERDLLSNIDKGIIIDNITTGRLEKYDGTNWIGVAGAGIMAPAAYGSMFQHNHSGDAMNATTKKWITALVGKLDGNGLITFVNDAINGDYLLVGTGGAGDYQIIVTCDATNAANNETIMEIHINGIDSTDLEDKEDTSSSKPRGMATHGIHTLADADKITLHLESTTPADEVKTYDCHVTIQRVS